MNKIKTTQRSAFMEAVLGKKERMHNKIREVKEGVPIAR
jgi:hypothetical protein